jgi:predicted Rossmann-fold nucleotide-binding protein
MSSSAIVILPGDHGTKNEAALALKFKKQAILFGPESEFTTFPEQISRTDDIEELREFLGQVRKKLRG